MQSVATAGVAADVRAGLLSPEAATRNHGPAWQTVPVPGDGHVPALKSPTRRPMIRSRAS
jgi:hypothetical protein